LIFSETVWSTQNKRLALESAHAAILDLHDHLCDLGEIQGADSGIGLICGYCVRFD
jgi:hypothetical protein